MRYAIYLDDTETEVFYSNEEVALKKYEEEFLNYKGEEVYEKIELSEFKVIKQDTL